MELPFQELADDCGKRMSEGHKHIPLRKTFYLLA